MIVAAVSTEFPMVLKDFPWCKKSAAGLPLQIYSHFDFFITLSDIYRKQILAVIVDISKK